MVDSNTKDFSQSIMELRYSWDKPDGTKETWEEICKRVGKHVLGVIDIPEGKKQEIIQAMIERKFIPGGRFLAQSGREVHQTQNCFLMRATDTREGWGELCDKATVALMSGGGIGVDYSDLRPKGSKLKRSGGVSSGCIPLIKVINEVGRGVMAGGNRRAAIYASLDWNHGDIFDFIHIKDWSEELRKIKEKDFDFPAPCDMTNISVNLDKSFFEAFENEDNPMHEHAQKVYWKVIHQMMKKAEPGFSINYKNKKESLRNAPVSGETWVVTPGKSVQIKNIVGQPTTIHTGYRWAENVVFELTEQDAEVLKIKLANGFELVLEPSHPVVIASKNGLRKIKAQNVKVGSQALVLNSEFMVETSEVVSISNAGTEDVYCADVHLPEHTFVANGIVVSNCTEIVSDKDSDVCCLGSLNFSKIESPEEVERITELGIIFLLAGTLYSDVPYDKVDEVRNEYRRLGLGIMGMAIWYAQRGLPYGDEESIRPWLEAWKRASDKAAKKWAKEFGLNVPVATRAIAPNGSTSIAGGQTTGGIEPIFAKAYQRRYLTPEGWRRQYVIDPFVEELYNQGADIDKVEDAYELALDVERRVRFQAFVQDEFVDNAISSTINLPAYGEDGNNNEKEFGEMLYKYLPKLRGITAYPDGARGGQPLTRVDFEYAIKRKNIVFEAREDCTEGICGL